jgi:glycosyltransferase involved in cell wall biosynthesis
VDLSVVIATLNRTETAKLMAERIRALLPDLEIEVIVVTPLVAEQHASTDLRFVADAGRGVYAAYNSGLRAACGEYVWFMGDDDYPLDAAAGLGGLLKAGAIDVLVAPVLFSSGRIYRPTRTLLVLHFLNWCQQGVIYRRRQLLRHRFFPRLKVKADQFVNILLRSDPAISKQFLAEPICMFGLNGLSGRMRDDAYRSLRPALARRTLGCGELAAFRVLTMIEPLAKRWLNVR